jgi:hypothetical protein
MFFGSRIKMYKKVFIGLLMFATGSCMHENKAKPGQGTITYKVSYPESNKYGIKAYLFPRQITVVFKDEKATFIASAGMGMVQLVNILDHTEKKYTSLLIDEMHGNYACTFSEKEIKENESTPLYSYKETSEKATIAGLKSRKAIVTDKTNHTSFDIWYHDRIKFYYWNSPFKDFNYLFTKYSHTINGLKMNLEATDVDLSSVVDSSLFTVKGNYKWVTQEEFYSHLSQL